MINARSKGKRVERLWRDFLNENGFSGSYRDAQQSAGVYGNGYHPDVLCPLLPQYHMEVKGVQKLNITVAMQQSIADSHNKIPIVAHKKNNQPWMVTMLAEDWARLHTTGSYIVDNQGNETR